jgi:hypothetical protein
MGVGLTTVLYPIVEPNAHAPGQGDRAHGQGAPVLGHLLDDKHGRNRSHDALEADRHDPCHGQGREAADESAGQVGGAEPGHSESYQRPPADPVGQRGKGQACDRAQAEQRTDLGQLNYAGAEVAGDRRQRQQQNRAREGGKEDRETAKDEDAGLPAGHDGKPAHE